jgi:peptidyl-prolyl cis-trans isomerase SurA
MIAPSDGVAPRQGRLGRKDVMDLLMECNRPFQFWLRRIMIGAALAIVAAFATVQRAEAQIVAVLVNGDPITNFDVEQRSKLMELANHKAPTRQQVLEELIDERLKIQLLKRYAIEGVDKDVDNAFGNMARRMRITPKQLAENLEKQGVKSETLKSRMKAEIIWSQIVRARYQSAFQFSDSDVQARLAAKKPEDAGAVGYDFTLRPILFVVPRGSPPTVTEARLKEAEALRTRFENCEQGIPLARGLGSVAVRSPTAKNSSDLPAALRDVLNKTELGHLTPPESTAEGIQLYAVCSKKPSDSTPAQKEARDAMFNEAFEIQGKKLLKELRSQAMIEYR